MCNFNGEFLIKNRRNILPLPFVEKLNYDRQRTLSFCNENMNEKWIKFLYNKESYMKELLGKQKLYKDENLRWKMYVQYVDEETPSVAGKSIRAGVSLDEKGRVPIPYDLYNFRKYPKIQSSSKSTHEKMTKPK